ncbi:TetR/AcrR family transcriptional regulator [Streptomyces sp. TLI_105]|uniref:TetR/AcrR family transcriptional regulator n=1 Tax=Streptomyces sp. TLI_105 TaxID=1881019 RepID=UPI00089A360D|nr:TetR/AcrR family transcriptional regulator [Streptomyces sp. TLI_105]SEB82707.1 transcriptional regulator, TetR family [Streptomyces sp. TLI_105]
MFEKQTAVQATPRPARAQQRGIVRRRAILDAAEALLGEQGYAAATLKAIGERAGIPTASVYHYFSRRHQVETELLRYHADELDARIGAALADQRPHTLSGATNAVIDPILDYFRSHPGCVELCFKGNSTAVGEQVRAFDEAQAERVWQLLTVRGLAPADLPILVVQLAFQVGNRLFEAAFRRSPEGDDATIREARRAVIAYVEAYASEGHTEQN